MAPSLSSAIHSKTNRSDRKHITGNKLRRLLKRAWGRVARKADKQGRIRRVKAKSASTWRKVKTLSAVQWTCLTLVGLIIGGGGLIIGGGVVAATWTNLF